MDSDKRLCMGCMNELDENGECQYCTYKNDEPYIKSALIPGTILDDRYIVGRVLSHNGEGISYICYDMVRKSKAVIREYMPYDLCERERGTQNLFIYPDCLAKFKTYMSEFTDMNRILSKLRNLTYISTPMDIFIKNNTTYVVIEYVDGVSLKKYLQINTGFPKWNEVKKMFIPFFTTISIIHNSGIIHRGISPENIIITTKRELKLTGFSISSIRTKNSGLTPEFYLGYTAPEQYSSVEYQGTWTDVYAVSAVMYRILTGCMPLDAKTRLNNDTLVSASKINSHIPDYISNVLAKGMAVHGEERIQTVDEFITMLFDRNSQLEHRKGKTQIIPINPPKKNYTANNINSKNQVKKTNLLMIIMSIIFFSILLGIGFYFLWNMLTSSKNETLLKSSSLNESVIQSQEETTKKSNDDKIKTSKLSSNIVSQSSVFSEEKKEIKEMPDFVGTDYKDVCNKYNNEFRITANYEYDDNYSVGQVIGQNIEAGTEYDPNKKNYLVLTVCKGPENVKVPDYSNLTYEEYVKILNELNIKYKLSKEIPGEIADKCMISGTNISVGENINVKEGEILIINIVSDVIYNENENSTLQYYDEKDNVYDKEIVDDEVEMTNQY